MRSSAHDERLWKYARQYPLRRGECAKSAVEPVRLPDRRPANIQADGSIAPRANQRRDAVSGEQVGVADPLRKGGGVTNGSIADWGPPGQAPTAIVVIERLVHCIGFGHLVVQFHGSSLRPLRSLSAIYREFALALDLVEPIDSRFRVANGYYTKTLYVKTRVITFLHLLGITRTVEMVADSRSDGTRFRRPRVFTLRFDMLAESSSREN